MASIVAYTTLQLTDEQKKAYFKDLGTAATESFQIGPQFRSVMWCPLPHENFHEHEGDLLNLFVYTAPDKTTEMKRELVRRIKEVNDKHFAGKKVNCVAIIKIHGDENVGVNGVLRWDTKPH